jgi:polyisoprenoid-binding protein YceI
MLACLFFALGAAVASEPATYKVVAGESQMSVHVGTAGLFKMFGHDHNIEVKGISGSVDWDENDPAASRFVLEVDASSLVVADEELSEEDRAQVQSDMESKALASKENPKIVFQSTAVEADKAQGAAHRLKIKGNLSLRGVTKPVEVPVTLEVANGRITAKGEMELDSGNWGVPQISAVGGSVKTKEELKLTYEIVAVP